MIVTSRVAALEPPSLAERQAILDAPVAPGSFREAFAGLRVLHAVEHRPPPRPVALGPAARIVFWNAERLKYAASSAGLLGSANADILMLCEVDAGMARTGNRHTLADLAGALESGLVFGVEFVELGLGDLREQDWHRGETNESGLHGAGLVSRAALRRPALARLEDSGRWFDGAYHERRVGGRIAIMAETDLAGTAILLVCAHYESHTDPEDRLLQTRAMLDAIDAHAPGRPALIGGDFNTSTFTLQQKRDPAFVAAALAGNPRRLVEPEPYEPMFAHLKERGYDWAACNAPGPTQRTRPDGTPAPPFGRIDWLFSRGLACTDAATIPAVDAAGVAISDHEALAVTIAAAP